MTEAGSRPKIIILRPPLINPPPPPPPFISHPFKWTHSVELLEETQVTPPVEVVAVVSEPVGKGQGVVHHGGVEEREKTGRATNGQAGKRKIQII